MKDTSLFLGRCKTYPLRNISALHCVWHFLPFIWKSRRPYFLHFHLELGVSRIKKVLCCLFTSVLCKVGVLIACLMVGLTRWCGGGGVCGAAALWWRAVTICCTDRGALRRSTNSCSYVTASVIKFPVACAAIPFYRTVIYAKCWGKRTSV